MIILLFTNMLFLVFIVIVFLSLDEEATLPLFPNTNAKAVEEVIKVFLKYSIDRDGGRSERVKKKNTVEGQS